MGEWENMFGAEGMSADFAPWESPCWNNDWEVELRENGNLTVKEWNERGRLVKEGEKGTWLPCAKVTVFNESQTRPALESKGHGAKQIFETFEAAKLWSMANRGKVFIRSPDGNGYIEK